MTQKVVRLERSRGFEVITVTQKKVLLSIVKRKVIWGVVREARTLVSGETRHTYGLNVKTKRVIL